MGRESLERAQEASRAAYLRAQTQRKEKAASAVITEKIKEIESGIIPESITELNLITQRAKEVQVVGDLHQAARAQQHLAGEEDELQTGTNLSIKKQQVASVMESTLNIPLEIELQGKNNKKNNFVELDRTEIEKRITLHEYVAQKTEEERQAEKAEALATQFQKIQKQRQSLPIFKVKDELIRLMNENQVVVVVGETGSGKTTQILQFLFENHFHENNNTKVPSPDASHDEKNEIINNPSDSTGEKRLICTQPRRIAAVSVAERVAKEMGCRCGSLVGYRVRFDDRTSPNTCILYMTDGMMLKEFINDPDLSTVSTIMIDEAHERSLNTDILLGLLRDVIRRNKKLKVIVASATLNADKFCQFFDAAPLFSVSGRTFPVEISYLEEPVADYVKASAEAVIMLHAEKPLPGDILVFLPGQEEIENCAHLIQQYLNEAHGQLRPLHVFPIYSSLPPTEQRRIYETMPEGSRKAVIATNIAETSITIDGVVYVIDCGLCKQDFYNPNAMVEELRVVPISQASATQRTGRAGRTQSGECFRLYTPYTFKNELVQETIPEIMRCSMSSVVLQLKALGIHNLLHFDFIDPPSTESLERALDHLFLLGAMKSDGRLTVTGRRMAEFPMDPSLSKCLIRAHALKCARAMAMAAAILSLDSIFINTREPNEKLRIKSAKQRFFSFGNGDVCGYVRIMDEWLKSGTQAADFCLSHGVNPRSMLRARDILDQILKTYDRIGLSVDNLDEKNENNIEDEIPNSENPKLLVIDTQLLTRALLSGFFMNVAKMELDRSYRIVRALDSSIQHAIAFKSSSLGNESNNVTAEIHPTSFLYDAGANPNRNASNPTKNPSGSADDSIQKIPPILQERPSLVLFIQLRRTTKRYMMHVNAIPDIEWILDSAPVNYFRKEELEIGLRKRRRE